MKTQNLGAVLASTPLNATAGRVVSQNGEHYEPPQRKLNHYHSETPLPIKPATSLDGNTLAALNPLLGRRFGRLTVLGMLDKPPSNKGASYVVRCVCGRYETRKRKALLSSKGSIHGEDRCSACWCVLEAKFYYSVDGARPLEDFTHRGQRY